MEFAGRASDGKIVVPLTKVASPCSLQKISGTLRRQFSDWSMVSFSLDISKIFRHFCGIRDGDWLARFLSNFLLSCFLVFLACFLAGTSDGWTQVGCYLEKLSCLVASLCIET